MSTNIPQSPQEPLPPAIALLVDKATRGSINDFRRLIPTLHNHGPGLARHPRILKLFLGFLTEREPFKSKKSEVFAEIALHGIRAVVLILEEAKIASGYNNKDTFLVPSLTQSWPDMWYWMNYKAGPKSSFMFERSKLTVDIITGICGNFQQSSIDRAIVSTPGMCSMIADVWMRQCEQLSTDKTFTLMQDSCTSSELLLHLSKSKGVNIKYLYETPRAREQTSSALLQMIEVSTRVEIIWMTILPTPLALVESLAEKSPELSSILFSPNSVGTVCRAFAVHSSRSLRSVQPIVMNLRLCLSTCLGYLSSAMLRNDGYACIVQVVQAGLIPALLKSARLGFEGLENHIVFLLQVLMRHTIYSSVLRASRVALEDPSIFSLEGQVPKTDTIWNYWTAFRSLLEERLALKAEFDEQEKPSCGSSECSNEAPPASYRICSGCLDIYYCSKACQRYDWKHGKHRDPCKTASQDRAEGTRTKITVQDRSLFLFIALAELTANARSRHIDQNDPLMAEMARNLAKDPARIIIIDLSTNPTTFTKDISPEQAATLSRPLGQFDMYTTEPDPDSSSTRLKVFLLVPYGHDGFVSNCIEFIDNELAGLIFARDAPKPTM